MQVGSDCIGLTSTDVVALFTTRLEEGGTLVSVTCDTRGQRWFDGERPNGPGAKGIGKVRNNANK